MTRQKKPEVFFENRGGAGPLAIYWCEGPYGNAIEADSGNGVGFFDDDGKLLAVQFDHVENEADKQSLRFGKIVVELSVKKGKIIESVKKISSLKPCA